MKLGLMSDNSWIAQRRIGGAFGVGIVLDNEYQNEAQLPRHNVLEALTS